MAGPVNGASSFQVIFANGTAQQRAWTLAALDACTFSWNRYPLKTVVEFVDDPLPASHFEIAATTPDIITTPAMPWPEYTGGGPQLYTGPTCPEWATPPLNFIERLIWPGDRAVYARVQIMKALDDPSSSYWEGQLFFQETVVHEFAHAIAAFFDEDDIAKLCGAFGITRAQWSPPATDRDSWMERGAEAFAETFKDLYLPRDAREYDNRTDLRLPSSGLQDFYDVLDRYRWWQPFADSWTLGGSWSTIEDDAGYRYWQGGLSSSPGSDSNGFPGYIGGGTWVVADLRFNPTIAGEDYHAWDTSGLTDDPPRDDSSWTAYESGGLRVSYTSSAGAVVVEDFIAEPGWFVRPGPTFVAGSGRIPWSVLLSQIPGHDDVLARAVPNPGAVIVGSEAAGIWKRWADILAARGASLVGRAAGPPVDLPRPPYPYDDPDMVGGPAPVRTVRRSNP